MWNEELKIEKNIRDLVYFLEKEKISTEIIIVDDGSTDSTVSIVQNIEVPDMRILRLIQNNAHLGKGHAVRQGMIASHGKFIMFMDSGGTVPLKFINAGLELIREKCDIAIGSRHHESSIISYNMIWYRRFTSLLFRFAIRNYLHIPECISDTQCGFKLYKGDIGRDIYYSCQTDGFLFDPECILTAKELDYRQCEFPIEWHCDRDSRLSILKNLGSVIKELRTLKKKFR